MSNMRFPTQKLVTTRAVDFDPNNVNLTLLSSDPDLSRQITCFFQLGENEYAGSLGSRISSVIVILLVSSVFTVFPVVAARLKWTRIPLNFYLFARYFGSGVIIATAFIHLLDPAYQEIGPLSCVGMTGNWTSYSWVPALLMFMVFFIFLLDLAAERYVEAKYGVRHQHIDAILIGDDKGCTFAADLERRRGDGEQGFLPDVAPPQTKTPVAEQGFLPDVTPPQTKTPVAEESIGANSGEDVEASAGPSTPMDDSSLDEDQKARNSFETQISAFLIMEFGIIFHSVIIGLKLGTAGTEFSVLYPVLVFHQSFEGLGIGARMSAIAFPHHLRWLPWVLCAAYGLTTPVSIAIGLGLRTTYNGNSFESNVVDGLFDAMSAGVLMYTGVVELLARDFFCNAGLPKDIRRLTLCIASLLLGTGIMACLAKWI